MRQIGGSTVYRQCISAFDAIRSAGRGLESGATTIPALTIIRAIIWAMIFVGLATRLSPLLDLQGRLYWQFMTEDGYLMQTVARNMAIGLGMSTADGTMPTNGVQPLATFIFAGLHWAAGGERSNSILLVTSLSVAVAAAAAYCLYELSRRLLSELSIGETLARIIAAVWFVGPLPTAHSMNGLETGIYTLCVLASLLYYTSRFEVDSLQPRTRQALLLGLLLGTTFLARNDAVFLIAALLGAHLCVGQLSFHHARARLVECVIAGAVSVAVALPWLVNNYLLFGNIVPISGISESYAAGFGQNLARIPANLLEAALPFVPIPRPLESNFFVIVISTLFLVAVLFVFWHVWGKTNTARQRIYATIVAFSAALSIYYGLFFGAPHFLARYLSILSPLLWFATALVGYYAISSLCSSVWLFRTFTAFVSAIFLLSAAFGIAAYTKGTSHMHKQVVEWVANNVASDQWVGAVQTGTLGYFHDRTINLDGKVNPDALRHLLKDRSILNYVVPNTRIKYIVDWVGMADWVNQPGADRFKAAFEVLVRDQELNLAVLRRR